MSTKTKNKIITVDKWLAKKRVLPESWWKAAGMLKKGQRKDLEKHVRTVRREWGNR